MTFAPPPSHRRPPMRAGFPGRGNGGAGLSAPPHHFTHVAARQPLARRRRVVVPGRQLPPSAGKPVFRQIHHHPFHRPSLATTRGNHG